ncbi:BTAD domain-containing putative transcriptional regulator [Actinomycetospora sp. OC33-EN08]|uniref:BTAD domain-containing putative transcriptional regulator n=1 Tax=Actinomycetospora aurantiaca TaxID=3129233 RepID=A0ABU8MNS7_9PSEU
MTDGEGLRFRDLGAVEVEVGGTVRAPSGGVLRRLLARLLVDVGRRVELDALAEAAWGDGRLRAASTLESHLWRVRRFLEPDRPRGDGPGLLVADAGGYRLTAAPGQVDSLRFADLVRDAEDLLPTSPQSAVDRAQEARVLWRGRPYGPCSDEEWALPAVARLEELHDQLLDTLVGALLAAGHPDRALVELEPVLAGAPLRERPWEHYVLAAARSGRLDEALGGYRRFERLFRTELGVDPSARMRALQADVLAGDVAPRGRVDLAAAATAPREVHLPRERARLVGRDADLAGLVAGLDRPGLHTLVGGAGCGKTTVAVAAAHRAAPDFADGVWFVDLTSALDDADVAPAVSSTLGLAGDGGAIGAVAAFAEPRRMLLVLDNCEHVLDGSAELVEHLLDGAGHLSVLATSREPLEAADETVVDLRPLPPGPAVELFTERLTHARGGAAPSDDEATLATAVCAAVDGVPLAIELAAARGRAFAVAEIAEQVRADPSALARVGGGRRGQQTVRAAVERSVRLLGPAEQELHTAMSVVPGPMTARMAAALVDRPPAEVDALLAGLVHRSLVVAEGPLLPGGPSRFAQLAIVRGHGAHQLDPETADRIADRRDGLVVSTVVGRPRMGAPGDRVFQDALDDDLPALRATLHRTLIDRPSWGGPALAAGLGMYWYYRGMLLEGGRWIGLAFRHRALARPVDDAVLASSGVALGVMSRDLDAARSHLDALCRLADGLEGEDLLHVGDEFAGLAPPALPTGDRALLGTLADRARDVADRTGDPTSRLMARAATLKARPREPEDQLTEAAAVHAAALDLDHHSLAWMAASDALRACLAVADVDGAYAWSGRALEGALALGARESPARGGRGRRPGPVRRAHPEPAGRYALARPPGDRHAAGRGRCTARPGRLRPRLGGGQRPAPRGPAPHRPPDGAARTAAGPDGDGRPVGALSRTRAVGTTLEARRRPCSHRSPAGGGPSEGPGHDGRAASPRASCPPPARGRDAPGPGRTRRAPHRPLRAGRRRGRRRRPDGRG